MAEKPVSRIGINGLGRIGRMVLRRYLQLIDSGICENVEIIAANDLAPIDALAYLLKYDSAHGLLRGSISYTGDKLNVNGNEIRFISERNPSAIPWKDMGVDVVLECTGKFKTHADLEKHLEGGASKVIISAPCKDADITIVMGVNNEKYDPSKHHIISNASCTTNSLAPVAKVLNDRFAIEYLFATTVHAYTSSQALVDVPTTKKSRGRAAAISIIPSSTGAAEATALVIPELAGRMEAVALRVPVPDGAITEIVANIANPASPNDLNKAIKDASTTKKLDGILGWTDEELVSIDIIGDSRSSIVNTRATKVLGRNMIYMQTWYDNEWGYSCRLLDLAEMVAMRIEEKEKIMVSLA
jgi:glyceraldehyde 3-phosphate dehydrogenase/glyceraldehyde-3-phosphate dehydrogenase (NAD(P))